MSKSLKEQLAEIRHNISIKDVQLTQAYNFKRQYEFHGHIDTVEMVRKHDRLLSERNELSVTFSSNSTMDNETCT